MATHYATEIAETLADLRDDGGPIVFTAPGSGRVYNDETGLYSGGVDQSTTSYALQLEDDPDHFEALGLTLRSPVMLMVAAQGLAFRPGPTEGTTTVTMLWAGVTYTVKTAEPFAPDGTPIYYTVVGYR